MAGNLKGRIVSSISAGFLHTCASTTEGKGFCWGSNMYDQLGDNRVFESDLPLEINTYGALKGKTISSTVAGTNITCAIDSEGLVSCWGEEWGEEEMKSSYLPVPFSVDGVPSEKTVVSMDTEGYRICVLDSLGLVSCGTSCSSKDICRFATLFDSGEIRFKKISVGHYHSCAISDKNKVYCWGGNRYGQTGSNSEEQDVDFSEVYSDGVLKDKKIVSVSAGWLYSCAADDKGAAYCWGMNNFGQLGVESSEKTFEPVAIDTTGELKERSVSILNAGFYHSCILDDKNRIICWGRNNYGQIGDKIFIKRETAFKSDVSGKIAGTISSISGGREHTCTLNDKGKIYCWGNNLQGQLGNGKGGCVEEPETQKCIPNYTHEPVEVDMTGVLKDKTVVSICAGSAHSCALDNEGAVYCWGLNGKYGALGNGSDQDSFVPSKVDASGVLFEKTIKEISCGSGRNCVLDSEGKVYCWGLNDVYGGLGAGSGPDSSVPVAVNTDGALSNRTVVSISSGWEHTCVLTSDKIIFCWGYNLYGMLGTGTTNRSLVPMAVTTAGIIEGDIISVEAGGYHTCALSSKNKIYCWGRNEEGQVGSGGEESRYLIPQPVKMTGVLNDKKIVEISAGFMHTCAKDNEGKIYCWGGDWFGQLGNAAMEYSHVPVAVEYKQ
jgi:alpha-tubulin suppressor-like RCC1 family protein